MIELMKQLWICPKQKIPNFYRHFIQGFSKITALLTSLLKTIGSSEKLALKVFRADDNEVVKVDSRANETVVNLFQNNKSKNSTCKSNIGATKEPNFLTPNAKKTFNHLRLAFIKAPIL